MEKFERRIEPLVNLIKDVCAEEGIDFLARFNLPDGSQYFGGEGDYVMNASDIFTQIKLWEAKHNKKLIPVPEENKNYTITINLSKEKSLDELSKLINENRRKSGIHI